MNIRIEPKIPTYLEGRKVIYTVCEATSDDVKKRVDRLHQVTNHNRQKVRCIDTGKIYESMRSAAQDFSISESQIVSISESQRVSPLTSTCITVIYQTVLLVRNNRAIQHH